MDNKIRNTRIRAGLTQKQMSQLTGIPLRTIENWETGARQPAAWVEKLVTEKLESVAFENGEFKDREHGVYTLRELRELLTPIFRQYNVEKAVLFGSYAKGMAHAKSDVDLLIKTPVRGLAFYGLVEDITETLCKEVDVLTDYQAERDAVLYDEIMRTGFVLYDRERQTGSSKAAEAL